MSSAHPVSTIPLSGPRTFDSWNDIPVRIRRRPLLAMMQMVSLVKGAGMSRYDPTIKNNDFLYQEVQGEKALAMKICQEILDHFELNWQDVEQELQQCPPGGWDAPGDVMDLAFLKDSAHGAM